MSARSLNTRLGALEALEAQQTETETERKGAASLERSRARLATLGFTSGDSNRSCSCGWVVPGISRYTTMAHSDPDSHRCLICGTRRYGLLGDRSWGYLPVPDYRCPCCDHAFTGVKSYVGPRPCPRCGWFVPTPPAADDPDDLWFSAVFLNLARVHGAPVAAAWLDVDEAEAAAIIAAVRPWWFEEVFEVCCTALRKALEAGKIHVYGIRRDGVPASTLCTDTWGLAPEDRAPDDATNLLNQLLAGWQHQTGAVVADVPGALAVLDDLSARMDRFTLKWRPR
jgi:hypothetical protein